MRLPRLSVAQRVIAAFVTMIALVLLASGTGLFFDQSVSQSIDTATQALDTISSANELENAWFQVVASTDYMLLTRQTSLIEGRLGEQIDYFNEQIRVLGAQSLGASAGMIEQNRGLMTGLAGLADELNAIVDALFVEAQAGSWTRAQQLRHTELAALQRRFTENLTQLQTDIRADVDQSVLAAVELQQTTRTGWQWISLLALVIGALAAFLTARSIIRPVRKLVRAARAVQAGDLSQRAAMQGNTEFAVLGKAFDDMTTQLGHSIGDLQHNVSQLERVNKERGSLIKDLEDALLFKDQFLATMSHELRTPLNAMLGYSALIQDEADVDEDVIYMVKRIESNATRLLNLINDILNISRINANRVEIVARPIDLRGMVQSWYNDFRPQAQERGLEFHLEIDPQLPQTIIGDEERTTQIIANLLQNAFKFTTKGHVSLKAQCAGEDKWSVLVADSGEGIPETWLHLIFDEFRQVDSGSKRKHGGAGLGLSIVKKLCLLMGGTVNVTSKLEVGSTFTVTLPLQTEPEAELVGNSR
jgi:signal transduction histidine kinase